MKMVEAIVREQRMSIVKERLRSLGVGGMTVSSVSGWSKERELHLQWRGQPVSYDLVPRIKFEIVISDDQLDSVIQTIMQSAKSSNPSEHGDGIIFISNIEQAINITTLEKNERAIK